MKIVHTYGNKMRRHASHRVFVRFVGCLTWVDVYLWVVGNHTLIHSVKGQFLTVWTPERTFLNPKLITMNGLSIHNFAGTVCGQLVLSIVTISYV